MDWRFLGWGIWSHTCHGSRMVTLFRKELPMSVTIKKSDDGNHLYIMGVTDLQELVFFLEIYVKLGWVKVLPREGGYMLTKG